MPYSVDIREFPPLLREFASYKRTIQGCSAKTVDEYLTDLRTFYRYLKARDAGIDPSAEELCGIDISSLSNDFILGVTTEQIYDFLLYTDAVRKNDNAAKSRKLSAIRAFFKFAVTKRHLLEVNPAADIDSPKTRQSLPKFLSLDECLLLLQTIADDADSPNRKRDYAMITLFLNCGMRVSELVGINMDDLDHELRSLRVIGKGNKERIVYLNDACRDALLPYLEERKSEKYRGQTNRALFISLREQRISVKTVQAVVYKYLDRAGLGAKHYSVHKLRHTAATLMYQSGQVDIRVLKDVLGHAQLNTTQIYTHVSNKSMEDAMNANPLASLKPTEETK